MEVPTTKLVVLVHQVVVLVEILLLLEEVIQDLPTQEQQMFPLDQTQDLLNGLAILVVKDRHRRAVINLAHNLGIQVVAEGVETEEQLSFLKNHRCNFAQGYLISRPIPVSDLEQALASGILVAGVTADSGL